MKSIISINFKFMRLSPNELIKLILNSKYTKGVELCVDVNSKEEMDYLDRLVKEIKNNQLILQIHCDISLPIDKQILFLKQLEKYSEYLNYRILVTLHSIYNKNKNVSLSETKSYIDSIIKEIDVNKVMICLENLNNYEGMYRLKKEDIEGIVTSDNKLYFTYDIGHEFADGISTINLSDKMIKNVKNVHIHTNIRSGYDHMPIYKDSEKLNEIVEAISYLKKIKYNYNIVYEYNLYECIGNNLKEQIKDYLNSIDFVSSYYKEDV